MNYVHVMMLAFEMTWILL